MRNALVLFLTLIFIVSLAGCSSVSPSVDKDSSTDNSASTEAAIQDIDNTETADSVKSLNIVCTTFPLYDWVREIVSDNPGNHTVTLLIDSKVDLHSYQPSVQDIAKISTSDLFLYVGGESDEWVDGALKQSSNANMRVLSLMELLGSSASIEEHVEGAFDSNEEHEEHEEYDEHVWLSLRNASFFCKEITKVLCDLDSSSAGFYSNNCDSYVSQLSDLDSRYSSMVAGSSKKSVLFADRFPFRYLMDDYGLSYYAAFSGCSAETEASFETITYLSQKVNELELSVVFVTESSDESIARTVISTSGRVGVNILVLDSVQSSTSDGTPYLSVMESNLEALTAALR